MKLPADLLTESPAEAARDIALAQLEACKKRARELAAGKGKDPLHDFRVSVRRLRSTLRAWKPLLRKRVKKKHTKALADVQTATGGGRDCEVAVEWIQGRQGTVSAEEEIGEAWVASALEARLQEEMGDVRAEALDAFDEIARKLRKRLERVKPRAHPADEEAPTFGAALGLALRVHMDDLIAHLGAIHSIDDVEEAHRARIRLKRLRYLVEPLRGVLPGVRRFVAHCRELQDILGDMNDARVLRAELEQLPPLEGEEAERIAAGLSSLQRGVDERQASLYATLERDWLANGAQVLREGINQMILACLQPGSEPMEIELKFLLSALPAQMPAASEITIDQGYLPGDHPRERLRAKARAGSEPQYVRTIKVGSGLERVEVEEAVSPAVFEVLWPLTEGCRIRKRRYVVPVGDRKWEIDEFLDRHDLYYAEIELDSADEEVILPDWLAPVIVRELTGEPGWSNLELAK